MSKNSFVVDHPADDCEIIMERGGIFFLRSFDKLPGGNVQECVSIYEGNPHKLKWDADHMLTCPIKSIPDLIAGLKALSGKLKLKQKRP